MKTNINQENFGTLCICAIRYCQGRRTYMPSLVQDIIKPHLSELSDKTIKVMLDDCGFQRRFDLYGDKNIDMPDWLRWEQILTLEWKKRNGNNGIFS